MPTDDRAIELLLASGEPAIRHAALAELQEQPAYDPDAAAARRAIGNGPLVRGLLHGQREAGGFGGHPYAKWTGAHWRLVSLQDLAVPPDTPGLTKAYETVLRWLLGRAHLSRVRVVEGRARRCGSQEGNALVVGVWLTGGNDERVAQLAANLVRWQWPDGGWNCDVRPAATHSSFNESHPPLLGLARFATATGDPAAARAAERAAEFVLRHRVVRSERTGSLVHESFAKLHYPTYWHYDVLAGLRALSAAGCLDDPRAADAVELLESRRRRDGTWKTGGKWWRPPGSAGSNVEAVDWGRGASEPLTLAALRILKAAGRWSPAGRPSAGHGRPATGT